MVSYFYSGYRDNVISCLCLSPRDFLGEGPCTCYFAVADRMEFKRHVLSSVSAWTHDILCLSSYAEMGG